MPSPALESLYRGLPSVDELLRSAAGQDWLERFPRALVVDEIRRALDAVRKTIAAGDWQGRAPDSKTIEQRVGDGLEAIASPSLKPVINATGVILHTNLGRAPLSQAAVQAVARAASAYSNLEYDLDKGRRGRRDVHAGELLERLLGAPAIVVNNNAAAVFLILNELSSGGETVVSRGELIEIGDGFRIPEILERSGARLREVGATNRTRVEDYRRAIGEETRALLRVHPSNFRMVGFTEKPSLEELAALAREHGLPLVEDLGSGSLYDLSGAGLAEEPPVAASLRAGVDLVCFSGDKLLGGPQAGIIAGRADLVARVRRNPLFRALRADKMTYAALEATLRATLLERWDEIPALAMIRASAESIEARAQALADQLGPSAEVVPGESVLGGGSTPAQTLPTYLVRLTAPEGVSAAQFEARLRCGNPPVVARIEDDRILVDLRTVSPEQEKELLGALRET